MPCFVPFSLVHKVNEYFYEGNVGQNVDRHLRLAYIALVSFVSEHCVKDVH